jgi:fumarate hydratase class I
MAKKQFPDLKGHFLEMIRRTSTIMPKDVVKAIEAGRDSEKKGSPARNTLDAILEDIKLSEKTSLPLCQDTGTLIFDIDVPDFLPHKDLTKAIEAAIVQATKKTYLRPNSVDPITGKNPGTNLGPGLPQLHLHQWNKDYIQAKLKLKGGGSENVSAQYKLPDMSLKAGRDLKGVYNTVIDAVWKAQGKGCAPGIIGIGIGGDRASGYECAKEQLGRPLHDVNPDPLLRKLEEDLFRDLNKLGIGPMGFGGNTTVLGVKAGYRMRLPACYFVSVAYLCWSARRKRMLLYTDGKVRYYDW